MAQRPMGDPLMPATPPPPARATGNPIPHNNGGDMDADNNGAASDGDGNQ